MPSNIMDIYEGEWQVTNALHILLSYRFVQLTFDIVKSNPPSASEADKAIAMSETWVTS
jgi:hypothetical protein